MVTSGMLAAALVTAGLVGGVAVTVDVGAEQTAGSASSGAARSPRNAEEFDALFKTISNWGRWGKDDQLGSANLVTPEKRKQAAGLVKSGVSVSLAHNPITETAPDNPLPFEHTMNRGFVTDTYRVSYHGYAHSHICRPRCRTGRRPVARRRSGAPRAHAALDRSRHQPARQSGPGGARRNGRQAEPLGVHADDRSGSCDRRHWLSAERCRDLLTTQAVSTYNRERLNSLPSY